MSLNKTELSVLQQRCLNIITDHTLSPKQKARYLSLEAENSLPYPSIDNETQQAMQDGCLCDMYEGHAVYKPRYVLPDYERFLKHGSNYLELSPAEDFDDALNKLMIIYHHVPSVTGLPVFLGYLDRLLMPYVGELTEQQLYKKLKNFWVMLDRVLPDAFMHANIGPDDTIICRTILKVDRELQQVAPNLTFMYHPERTPDALYLLVAENICMSSKPHIANMPLHEAVFDEQGYGIVSCYNALPIAGGGSTLCRLNLKAIAEKSSNSEDFLTNILPYYCQLQYQLIEARTAFLYEDSHFFEESFLVHEGLIDPQRFTPMFGIYAMAEAVNILMQLDGKLGRYGRCEEANALAVTISQCLSNIVLKTPVTYGWKQRAILHAQSGISLDKGTSAGVRIPYGEEPDPVNHILTVAPHHQYYHSGISDILTIDETIKKNPEALLQLCKGAFANGMREFTATIQGNDLIRVTGYMVRLSEIKKFKEGGSRTDTTCLGSEAVDNCNILHRNPRVVSGEQIVRYD